MLKFEKVTKSRTLKSGGTIEVLKELSFEVKEGEIAGLLGPSGGGKSTALRLANRLEDPDAGTIHINGDAVTGVPVLELRRRVGLVLQKPTLIEGTAYDNMVQAYRYSGEAVPGRDDARLTDLVRLAQLDATILDRASSELSVGQQQRVAIVRALMPGPRVLLMDEPTSALDPRTGKDLLDMLRRLLSELKTTALIATHDLAAARQVADRVLFLDGGRIVEEGPPGDLFDSPKSPELRRFLSAPDDRAEGEGA